jgi:hypothetical protein
MTPWHPNYDWQFFGCHGLASIKGPGYSSIFLVDLFVPKIKLRERECVAWPLGVYSDRLCPPAPLEHCDRLAIINGDHSRESAAALTNYSLTDDSIHFALIKIYGFSGRSIKLQFI